MNSLTFQWARPMLTTSLNGPCILWRVSIRTLPSCTGVHLGSVLAWRVLGTGEPGGLPSMGLQSQIWLKWLSSSSSSLFTYDFRWLVSNLICSLTPRNILFQLLLTILSWCFISSTWGFQAFFPEFPVVLRKWSCDSFITNYSTFCSVFSLSHALNPHLAILSAVSS